MVGQYLSCRLAASLPTWLKASTMIASRKLSRTRNTNTSNVQKKAAPATAAHQREGNDGNAVHTPQYLCMRGFCTHFHAAWLCHQRGLTL